MRGERGQASRTVQLSGDGGSSIVPSCEPLVPESVSPAFGSPPPSPAVLPSPEVSLLAAESP